MCDPNIINVLIDQVNIEAVLLIDERRTAARVIVHDRPKGARSAYTKEGDQVLQHAHYSNKYGKLGIIQESVESAIREEEAQLDSLRGERDGLESIRRQVDQQVDRNRRSVVEAIRKVKRKVAEKRNLTMSIEELKNAEDEEEPEEDIATYVCYFCCFLLLLLVVFFLGGGGGGVVLLFLSWFEVEIVIM